MANANYTLGDFRSELPNLLSRSGSGSGAASQALVDMFHARARRRIQRAHTWIWQQTRVTQDLAVDDASFAEPADVLHYQKLFIRDTATLDYICPMSEISREKFDRLVSQPTNNSVEELEVTLSSTFGQAIEGTPRIYSRWAGSIYLFPVVTESNLTVVIDYYKFLEPNLTSQVGSYYDALLQLFDLSLMGAAYEGAIHFRDSDMIQFYGGEFRSRLAEEIAADCRKRDKAEGEYADDQLAG